jgi:hypothetical protein
MKCAVFWNVAPCNPEEEQQKLCLTLISYFFLALLFDPEDGGNMLIRNVTGFLRDHMALNRASIALSDTYEGWNFNNGNTAVETPCNGTK